MMDVMVGHKDASGGAGVGLRERKAARTREAILDAALHLFVDQGYEATTMEEIAESAEVGSSTLYRYFPTKESLLTQPLAARGRMAAAFDAQPDDDLGTALGGAIQAFLADPQLDPARRRTIASILRLNDGPRARLWEVFIGERALLERAIAQRLGRAPGDIFAVLTARLAGAVVETIFDNARDLSDDPEEYQRQIEQATEMVARVLRTEPPVVPSLGL